MKHLNERFAELGVKRYRDQHKTESSFPTEILAVNIEQRKILEDTFDWDRAVQVGDIVGPFELVDARGARLSRDEITANGPAVLIFFRYGECPADNVALPYYDEALWPILEADGVRLIAISPQRPEKGLRNMKKRHTIGYTLACDPQNKLARRLGITFVPKGNGNIFHPVSEITGILNGELPITSALVLDASNIVRFTELSPNWLVRAEPPAILKALADMRKPRARQAVPQGRHL